MLDSLRDNHTDFLGALFAFAVIAIAWLEVFYPRRSLQVPRLRRWVANLSLGAFNIALLALAVSFGTFAAAIIAEQHGWGVLRSLTVPTWLAIPLGILAIDLFGYVTHRLLHGVSALWRLHHVHHSDIDIDFTTAVRHHPLEILLTAGLLSGATVAIGVSPESAVLYQVLATVLDLTSHGNVRIPQRLDGGIRSLLVTPDMHVVHHSARKRETDSNYGTVFSFWDRLFGSYVAKPAGGLTAMTIGLEYGRDPAEQRLDRVLLSPFAKPPPAMVSSPAVAVTPD